MEKKEFPKKFSVIILGIIFDPKTKKILIARKKEGEDKTLTDMTWFFPGPDLEHGEDLDKTLKKDLKEKTGYDIKNLGAVFSKTYPERKELLAVYFLCEVFNGKEKMGKGIVELKWVKPEELGKYFTTSFHPRLKEYLMNIA